MSTTTDRLVDDYLRRLEAAAAHLPRSRRAELVAEIREHIEAALRQEDAADEVAVRNVLERLGPPEEIVAAAEPPPDRARRRAGVLEIVALLVLLVPVVGWVVEPLLVFASDVWSRRDKLVGFALLLTLVFLSLAYLSMNTLSGEEQSVPPGETTPSGLKDGDTDDGAAFALALLPVLVGLPSALYLGWRLRRHPSSSELS
jgi:hypothetical protein